jgi:hypothetical protein
MGLALFAGGVSVAQPQPEPIAPQSQQASPASPAAQGPMPVRVIDRPRTEAQIAAEQRDRADRVAFSDQLLIFAALLVAVGAFLAIAFAVQVFYLGLGLRAMRSYSQRPTDPKASDRHQLEGFARRVAARRHQLRPAAGKSVPRTGLQG